MIRVVVAARSSVIRAGLESVVRSSASLQLTGALDVRLINSTEIEADVLLVEAGDALPELTSLPTVLLIDASDTALVRDALRSGVHGVISRDATAEELESAIHAVHAGLVVMPAGAIADLLPERRAPVAALTESLSDRELEVLSLIAEGQSNKLIAHGLGISEHTVKTHVASIFAKLAASSRTEAVSQAIRRGLVML